MGGEITWACQGTGDYIFQLKVYRDCNGSLASATQTIDVWNHPTLSSITLNQVSQTDISPGCTPVAGSPSPVTCAGAGTAAVEEYIYQSAPIAISGVPPAQGWTFTWDSYNRTAGTTNTNSSGTYGITLYSVMYAYSGTNTNPCFDSSPQFPNDMSSPFYSAVPAQFNHNAYDPDLDSLAYSFAEPLDGLIGVVSFNPPASPVAVPWAPGYSTASPLPDVFHHPSNVPASLNPYTGSVSFTSFTIGKFSVPIKVESWKCGTLVAEVFREVIVTVITNPGGNNPPVITPPFAGGTTFFDTVYAGQVVVFNLASIDTEFLQDGVTLQSNTLVPTGGQFGTGFSNPAAGCPNPPCATLSDPMPLTGSGGIYTTFTWQTDCSHLENPTTGCLDDSYTHTFTFRVRDDYCAIPAVSSPTVAITVLSLPPLNAPELKCTSVAANGDATITWVAPPDPLGSFDHYEIFSATALGGPYSSVGTVASYATTSFTHVGAGADLAPVYYYVTANSGCNGIFTSAPSDSLATMFLNVVNPFNGTALLLWNQIHNPNISTSSGWYHVYQEYPVGTWTLLDSVPYGTETYIDTITICFDYVSYRVEIEDASGCTSVSSIDGDWFQDLIPPDQPVMQTVSVDTATGFVDITWIQSPWNDTEGYIIMYYDGVNWIIIDTVWGITNTTYTDLLASANDQSEMYGIAAFDSCWTGAPPTPNTSARGIPHRTMHLTSQLDVCNLEVSLVWNRYYNWNGGVQEYRVKAIENGGPAILLGTTTGLDTFFIHASPNPLSNYCYVIEAVSNIGGYTSLSNKSCVYTYQPTPATYGYLSVATVTSNNSIDIRYIADPAAAVQEYRIERALSAVGPYSEVGTIPQSVNPHSFTDTYVDTQEESYFYRAVVVDSCGAEGVISNYNKTILLTADAYSESLINVLSWSAYEGWSGAVTGYNIYRSDGGAFNFVATVSNSTFYYEDDISGLVENTYEGEFCYYIEATESMNIYGVAEIAHSNVACAYQDPKFWIPNAFMVGGVNNIYKPVAGFVDLDSYYFSVYNRWGQMLFGTDDINAGWDGTYQGNLVEEGAYVYYFTYKTSEGQTMEHRGTFVMLVSSGGE